MSLPTYTPFADFLFDSGTYLEACELHGMLCGFICNGLVAPNAVWMSLLLLSTDESRRIQVEKQVNDLFRASLEQLESFGFDFDILLPTPEEGQDLLAISKLSQWSESFLLGLQATSGTSPKKHSKDVEEAIDDIKKVSRIYNQVLQCNEPFDEEAFTALLEHVKVSVMLIFTELNGRVRPTKH